MPLQLPGLSNLTVVKNGKRGVVYRAWQAESQRTVVVKVLTGQIGQRKTTRFTEDTEALATVSGHPNIVPVYAVGTTPGNEPYVVMGLCADGSLADRLRRGTIGWKEMLTIGVALSGALHTAHEADVLHGDITPGNIFVDAAGAPRLADFGQATLTDTALALPDAPDNVSRFTAPERRDGGQPTRAADLYSLAATLLTLVNGPGRLRDPRSLRVPDRVCRVLEWGMHRDPAKRPPDALAFGKALQEQQQESGMAMNGIFVVGRGSTYPPERPAVNVQTIAAAGEEYGITQPRTPPEWLPTAAVAVTLLTVIVVLIATLRPSVEPRAIPAPIDPARMLLLADDYGIAGLREEPEQRPAFRELLGTPAKPAPTELSRCLDTPNGQIERWQHSPYYATGPAPANGRDPVPFTDAQSAGLVMSDATAARGMVDPWNSTRFDGCQTGALSSGPGGVGDTRDKRAGQPSVISLRQPAPLPEDTVFAGKRLRIPLTTKRAVYLDVQLVSYGRTVVLTAVTSYPKPPSAEQGRTLLAAMIRRIHA